MSNRSNILNLIKRCEYIALYLFKGRFIAIITGLVSFVLLVYATLFLSIEQQNTIAVPCLLIILWSLLFFVFIRVFSNTEQPVVGKYAFFARAKRYLIAIFYKVFACIFLLLTLSILYLTYKMLLVWFRSY